MAAPCLESVCLGVRGLVRLAIDVRHLSLLDFDRQPDEPAVWPRRCALGLSGD